MKISKNGLAEVKKHEGVRNQAYLDSAGVWTIGVGHTAARGAPIPRKGMVISDEEVEATLDRDLDHFEEKVNEVVKVPLNQNQFDALVSLCFNIGEGAFSKSTLVRRLNAGKYQEAADQFLVWNKAGGRKVQGLVNRRIKERALFLKPVGAGSVVKPVETPSATPVASPKENWLVRFLKALRSLLK
jgi:lysozyme